MINMLFAIWLVLTPFIVWNSSFEGPKAFVFLVGGFLLSFYWIVKIAGKPGVLKLERRDLWYLGWLAVLAISSLLGVHPKDSILGGSYRHQGVIFFLTLWLIGKTFEVFGKKEKEILYKGMGFAVIAEGLVVLYQIFFGKLYIGKPLGTLGEANAVAGFLAIGSYFVFTSFPKIFFVVPAVSILLTQSRAGVLAFAANIAYLSGLLVKKTRILLIVLGVVSVGGLVAYFSLGKGTSVFENRQVIWPMAVQAILKKPVLGYGAESGEVVFDKAFKVAGIPLKDLIFDRAHNLFLDVAMWSGAVGLILFCGFLYWRFKTLEDTPKKFAFIAFTVYAFLQPLSVVHWILFFLI